MLPYKTVTEAEAVLGRALTGAETLWLNYSADKSDYFLYCHIILIFFLIFSIFPFIFILLGHFEIKMYKIQPKVKNSISDSLRCYPAVVMPIFIFVILLMINSYPLIQMMGIRTSLPLPSMGEMAAQLVVYFTIEDYTNYWVHRFLHLEWGYEKIHRVHHERPAPIGFEPLYVHWAEAIVMGYPSFLGPAIAPCHVLTFWVWMIVRELQAVETHSGYDFPWNPTRYIPFYGGADHHDFHHFVGKHSRSNFASVFTYCDYIYGTDKGYRYHRKTLKQA